MFRGSGVYDDYFGAAVASIEERIYLSDIVVRATLASSASDLLTFNAVEYLKGTGPTQFTVSADTANRNAQWDGNEAVLFLSNPDSSGSSGTRSVNATFEFTDTTTFPQYRSHSGTRYTGTLTDGFTIDGANPVWLPSDSTSQAGRRSGTGRQYIESSMSISGTALPTVSLAELRAKIAWVEGGDGIEGYDLCVRWGLDTIRTLRDWEVFHEEPFPQGHFVKKWVSGEAAPRFLSTTQNHIWRMPAYGDHWVAGDDAAFFAAVTVDEDTDPSNGYARGFVTVRPLIAGSYSIVTHMRDYRYNPCNFFSLGVRYTVNVTAPAGTVHEAFFDPAGATAVGFDSGGGELTPATFTADGVASTVQALKYENGEVVLELNPFNALIGLHLLFIELDGSIGLSLAASSATADATAGTLTWSVAEAPWEAGDQLMLRITSTAPPAVEITGLVSEMEESESDGFTVSVSDLVSTADYTISVTTDSANTGFDSDCSDSQEDVVVTSGNTSHSTTLTLHGCASPGGTVTAELLTGGAPVVRATQTVTVKPPLLSGLTLSGVDIGTFAPASRNYVASVANRVEETTVTATASDDGATYEVKLGGVLDEDGVIPLAVGENVITVEVTAEDGNTSQTYTVTVTRSEPLTAAFEAAPESHNGTDAFTFRIAFSEAVAIGFANFRRHALDVTEGSVTGASRVDRRSDLWKITVEPDSLAGVSIVLPITEDCAAQGAICTRAGDPLSSRVELAVPGENVAVAGSLTISGTLQVGEALTVDTSGVSDGNGLDGATFSYQWIRSDAGTDTDIAGATGAGYTLAPADNGKTIKVRVSFTDDAGYAESLTGATTDAVSRKPNSAATGSPTISGTLQVEGTLTVDTSGISDGNGLNGATFSYQWIRSDAGTDTDIAGATGSTYTLVPADEGKTIKVRVSFTDDAGHAESRTGVTTETVGPKPNSEATGDPTISGTLQVEATLTVGTSGISDADGLDSATFSYQWIRSDAGTDTDIAGATVATYTLVPADEGKTIKVRVSFTDDAGHAESRTGATTDAVRPADLSNDSSTTGEVTVGVMVKGYIDEGLDVDWFRISLLASETYQFDMRGSWGGAWVLQDGEVVWAAPGTLHDPKLLGIFGGDSVLVPGSDAEVSGNDRGDSVEGLNSRIASFSPPADGDYYIAAASESGWTGSYELTVTIVADE